MRLVARGVILCAWTESGVPRTCHGEQVMTRKTRWARVLASTLFVATVTCIPSSSPSWAASSPTGPDENVRMAAQSLFRPRERILLAQEALLVSDPDGSNRRPLQGVDVAGGLVFSPSGDLVVGLAGGAFASNDDGSCRRSLPVANAYVPDVALSPDNTQLLFVTVALGVPPPFTSPTPATFTIGPKLLPAAML